MTSPIRCKYCGKELPTQNFALFGSKPVLVTLPCDCEMAQNEAKREEYEAERNERARAFSSVWSRSDVPERFLHVESDSDMARPLLNGKWLYLYGENGRGKTHAACQAAKAYLVKNTKREKFVDTDGSEKGGMMICPSFHFTEAQNLLSDITSSWNRWDMNEDEVKSRWAGVDLLVLDDFGKGVPSEWAAEKLFEIVNKRWSNNKLTIITSQYGITELSERYKKAGEETLGAMISRLKGECVEMPLLGSDRRLA